MSVHIHALLTMPAPTIARLTMAVLMIALLTLGGGTHCDYTYYGSGSPPSPQRWRGSPARVPSLRARTPTWSSGGPRRAPTPPPSSLLGRGFYPDPTPNPDPIPPPIPTLASPSPDPNFHPNSGARRHRDRLPPAAGLSLRGRLTRGPRRVDGAARADRLQGRPCPARDVRHRAAAEGRHLLAGGRASTRALYIQSTGGRARL